MRFSTFLLLFFLFFQCFPQAKAQNLIADWSAEEYETCPTGLALTQFIPTWLSLRGNPDYFNTCSPNLGPLTNPFGWQHPKSGEGTMGVITHHSGLVNGREYPGAELIEPLEIGQTYEISFYVAAAFSPNASGLATNNLGILLMTENYLTFNELGIIPNFAHYNQDALVTDTANWVHIHGVIVADSAYNYVAFGNFFDDANTQVVSLDPEDPDPSSLAYYYFDDFCVVKLGQSCSSALSIPNHAKSTKVEVFPNPSTGEFYVRSDRTLRNLRVLNQTGKVIREFPDVKADDGYQCHISLDNYLVGLFILEIETEQGTTRSKIVINP